MEAGNGRIRILMLPWLAHGHVSPFFELAKLLAARNFHIYFCSTAVNLLSVKRKLTQKLSSHIELVELNLPTSPELPPHRHTTSGLPPHLMTPLKRAFDMAAPAFAAILRNLHPDLVLYDFLQPWAPAAALSADITAVMFQPTGALMAAMVIHWLKFPDSDISSFFPEIRFSEHEIIRQKNMFRSSENDAKDGERVIGCSERSCGMILLKSFREIEGKYIDSLSASLGKKVVPVGPLVPDEEDDTELGSFGEWLNGKERSSSIFVSFGSEFYLSKENMEEIAHGLELSQVSFVWVVRFPEEGGERKRLEEQLPSRFLERVRERGMVVEGWAPQAQILKHPSVGGFVSHCGWSSVMESMKFGVPIIAMPMHLDQPPNSRLVERLGLGVLVDRDDDDGGFHREEVARVIREVVVEKRGERVRNKTKEFAEIVKKKDNEDIDIVVKELVKICRKQKKDPQSNSRRTAIDGHCSVLVKIDGAAEGDGRSLSANFLGILPSPVNKKVERKIT